MIFSVNNHIALIKNGKKTVTRRCSLSGKSFFYWTDNRTDQELFWDVSRMEYSVNNVAALYRGKSLDAARLWVYAGGVYALQTKRGGKAQGFIQVTSIGIEIPDSDTGLYAPLTVEQAAAEGEYTPEEYSKLWADLYHGKDRFRFVIEFRYAGAKKQ